MTKVSNTDDRTSRFTWQADELTPVASSRTWSPQQTAVFDWFATGRGHLVVRARAGTGKTTTIVEGVSRAPEKTILLAAFNKEIATELQARVASSKVEVKTLHALGLRYIKRNWTVQVEDADKVGERALSLTKRVIPSAPERVQKLVSKLHSKVRELQPFASSEQIDDVAAQFDILPDDEMEEQGWTVEACSSAAYDAVQLAKQKTAVVDYADMIFLPIANRWIRPWFDLVVVDEAQDMTETQLEIAQGACKRGGRVCVVGDDQQAIYGFRGADVDSLDRLKKTLRARELGLTVTYRCGTRIVALAAELVPDFTCAPGAIDGEIVRCDDEKMLLDVMEGDFVISRKNAPLVKVCMALLKLGKRARVRGRDVGRGIVALIKKLRARTVADIEPALSIWAQRESAKAARLSEEAKETRLQFVADQVEVVLALCEGAATVSELEARVEELFSDDKSRGAVLCGTVHKMKGLEAERTFLLEGTFRPGVGEESRLRYVAITRAKSRLCWVSGFDQ